MESFDTTIQHIIKGIKQVMNERDISQTTLAEYLQNISYPMAQGTISKILSMNSNITLEQLYYICKALDLELANVLPATAPPLAANAVDINHSFVTDPQNSLIQPYLGEYHCYFYRVGSGEPGIKSAKLDINPSAGGASTTVRFVHGLTKDKESEYTGKLFMASKHHNAYGIVSDEVNMGILLFPYGLFLYERPSYFVAYYLSSSEGPEPSPCVRRMIVSHKALGENQLAAVSSQLLFQEEDIVISDSGLSAIQENPHIPAKLVDTIKRLELSEPYHRIPEALLYSGLFSTDNPTATVNTMRNHSIDRPYYRISSKQGTFLESALKGKGEEEET